MYELFYLFSTFDLIYYLGFSGLIMFIFIKSISKIYKFFRIEDYTATQKIHEDQYHISREGGFSIFIGIVIFWYFNYDFLDPEINTILGYIIFCTIPILIAGVLEDLFQNVKPSLRLFSIFLSAFLFLFFQGYGYPYIEIPFLVFINNYDIILFILFSLAITSLCNGMNIIDGTNGLAATNAFACLASIAFLAYISVDFAILNISLIMACFLIVFLIFNYPWGKIFLGDFGAYFYGWIIALLLILLFARNPDLPTWNAVLIVFYPIFEVIFSYLRKILSNKNPMQPDGAHFHLKLYFLLLLSIKRKRVANCLVLPFMCFFWLLPSMIIPWIYTNVILIFLMIFLLSFFYIAIYFFLPNIERNE